MELTELKTLLSENKDSDEYKSLIKEIFGGSESEAKYEEAGIRKFFKEDETGKKLYTSILDSETDIRINKWKENNLNKLVADEVKKLNPDKSPIELELEQLKADLAKEKSEKIKKEQLNYAITNFDYKLPSEILEKFIGENDEQTKNNLTSFGEALKGVVTGEFKDFYKSTGKNPSIVKDKDDKMPTTTDVRHMSSEDFIKYGDKVK